jgi:hypothetical protein
MRVSTGPCVPPPGRAEALCSPLQQHGGEEPTHTSALYAVLTGRPSVEALEQIDEDRPGRLFVCRSPFVEAMAAANDELQRLADEDESQGDDELHRFTRRLDAIDAAWLTAAPWPKNFVGTRNRLAPRLGLASAARASSEPLWCWYGPSIPQYTVRTGTGPYPGKRR